MLITDGAWGTQLQARGLAIGELPDAWNLAWPDRVAEVAREYAAAGSDIILTNTFRANRISLAGHGLSDQVEAINRAGVEISRSAGAPRVFASIGPSGKLRGDVSEPELYDAFAEQAAALTAADGLVVETMADLEEAVIAVRAAKTTGLLVVACMVFDTGRQKDRTMMGDTPESAASALAENGADVIGANCGLGVEGYVRIAERLRAAADRPIWIKPNAGLPELVDGSPVYRTAPEEFASFLPALAAAGAAYAGGCCGTTPAFIRALVKARGVQRNASQAD
jgi:methionine synthase I (cobalamin-dependent)